MKTFTEFTFVKIFVIIGLPFCVSKTSCFAQHQVIKVSKICSFSKNELATKACHDTVELPYDVLSIKDTLSVGINFVLTKTALRESSMTIGVLGNLALSGVYCKPDADKIPRLLIGITYKNDYWTAMGILLHELGHLLNHHENICSSPEFEDDADIFAGRCLALIGATPEQAVQCMGIINDGYVSDQYHTKELRKEKIMSGYNSYYNSIGVSSYTSINPLVRWKQNKSTDSFEVTINDRTINIPDFSGYSVIPEGAIDPNLGILYISASNSTYQLSRYGKDDQGMGQLVNDKTSITYMRFGVNSYRIYNKAKIIPNELIVPEVIQDTKDYMVNYNIDKQANKLAKIVFVDYFFTPTGVLRPAFFK